MFFVHLTAATRLTYSDLAATVRDDNHTTCVQFLAQMTAPWHTDFSVPISYLNSSLTVTVALFGENIGCSSGDDGRLYTFPISSWNNSTGPIGRRKTCIFIQSSTVIGTEQQKCAYQCKFPLESVALRVIRLPLRKEQFGWKLCEVSNLFYGMTSSIKIS